MAAPDPTEQLERLRAALRAENISYGELADLQDLAAHIAPDDVELLEPAGVPEHGIGRLTQERDHLMILLDAQGGRGVDLAERIDALNAQIEAASPSAAQGDNVCEVR